MITNRQFDEFNREFNTITGIYKGSFPKKRSETGGRMNSGGR